MGHCSKFINFRVGKVVRALLQGLKENYLEVSFAMSGD